MTGDVQTTLETCFTTVSIRKAGSDQFPTVFLNGEPIAANVLFAKGRIPAGANCGLFVSQPALVEMIRVNVVGTERSNDLLKNHSPVL